MFSHKENIFRKGNRCQPVISAKCFESDMGHGIGNIDAGKIAVEEGDNVIKKAASILIVNQLENTDIIRTDGNEFLIYMVGYDEKKVIEFTRKINKELKELPHGFGATLGYSMIEDDVKTIDDAINEATLSMRQAKEKI